MATLYEKFLAEQEGNKLRYDVQRIIRRYTDGIEPLAPEIDRLYDIEEEIYKIETQSIHAHMREENPNWDDDVKHAHAEGMCANPLHDISNADYDKILLEVDQKILPLLEEAIEIFKKCEAV